MVSQNNLRSINNKYRVISDEETEKWGKKHNGCFLTLRITVVVQ